MKIPTKMGKYSCLTMFTNRVIPQTIIYLDFKRFFLFHIYMIVEPSLFGLLYTRTDYWQSIGQEVDLQQNTMYAMSAYVKQLNNNTKMWQTYRFTSHYQWSDDGL